MTTSERIAAAKVAFGQLEELCKDEFAEDIAILRNKFIEHEQQAEQEVKEIAAEIKGFEQTLIKKYGQAAVHAVEILLLLAILWRLFR